MVHISQAIKEIIEKSTLDELKDFVKIVDKSAAWYLVSDYCFDEPRKVSDTVTFSLILKHDKFENIREYVNAHQPCDIKSTSEVREGFLKYLVCPVVYNFSFILTKTDKFLLNSLPNQEIVDFIELVNRDIQVRAIHNPTFSEYFDDFKKRIAIFKEQKKSKAFNWKLMRKIFIISSIASVIIYEISKLNKPLAIQWVSDRDGIVEQFDNIALDLAFINYIYLCSDFGNLPVADLLFVPKILFVTSKKGMEDDYDELVRIPDFIAGTIASINESDFEFKHGKYYPVFYSTIANVKNHSIIAINDKNNDFHTRRMKFEVSEMTDEDKWESVADMISANTLSKQINKTLHKSDSKIYMIHKDDILACDLTGIQDIVEVLCKNQNALLKSRGSLEVWIAGYDEDPREAYDIPEIRKWYAASIEAGIPWFYFLGEQDNGMGLSVLLFACCDITMKCSKDGMAYAEIADPEQIDQWFNQNYNNLNKFVDSNKIPDEINKEMSLQAKTIVNSLFVSKTSKSAL